MAEEWKINGLSGKARVFDATKITVPYFSANNTKYIYFSVKSSKDEGHTSKPQYVLYDTPLGKKLLSQVDKLNEYIRQSQDNSIEITVERKLGSNLYEFKIIYNEKVVLIPDAVRREDYFCFSDSDSWTFEEIEKLNSVYEKFEGQSLSYKLDKLCSIFGRPGESAYISEILQNHNNNSKKIQVVGSDLKNIVTTFTKDNLNLMKIPFLLITGVKGRPYDVLCKYVEPASQYYNIDDKEQQFFLSYKNINFDPNRHYQCSKNSNSEKWEVVRRPEDDNSPEINHIEAAIQNAFSLNADKFQVKSKKLYVWMWPLAVTKQDDLYYNRAFIFALSPNEDMINHLKGQKDKLISHVMDMLATDSSAGVQRISVGNYRSNIIAAIAAIMSRNMSHNLGSHYIQHTKSFFLNESKNIKAIDKVVKNDLFLYSKGKKRSFSDFVGILSHVADDVVRNLESVKEQSSSIVNNNAGIVHTLRYLQSRMDYNAAIIENLYRAPQPVDFMTGVYQTFCSDENNSNQKNFLLDGIARSDGFTRSFINNPSSEENRLIIKFVYRDLDGNEYSHTSLDKSFTPDARKKFSAITFGIPDGGMSSHAIFNIFEAFIRNSAKHSREDFVEVDGHIDLVFTIRIEDLEDDKYYKITISDNKKNGKKTLDTVLKKLRELKIVDESFNIEKNSKGLKEMLISSAWLQNSRSIADVLLDINNSKNEDERLSLIKAHCFTPICNDKDEYGISFRIPKLDTMQIKDWNVYEQKNKLYEEIAKTGAEIVVINNYPIDLPKGMVNLRKSFPRLLTSPDDHSATDAVNAYKQILEQRFPDFSKYVLELPGSGENGNENGNDDLKKYKIVFRNHENVCEGNNCFAYTEAVTGDNFTGNYRCVDDRPDSEYFKLKIMESALTRITIIDDRLFPQMQEQKKQLENSQKNIRILNTDLKKEINKFSDIFITDDKNQFLHNEPYGKNCKDATHFLSIHLSLLEEICTDPSFIAFANKDREFDEYDKDNEDYYFEFFLKQLEDMFSCNGELFITIHSGRGGLVSEKTEGLISNFPFIALSNLENEYENCKFKLSELFYTAKPHQLWENH